MKWGDIWWTASAILSVRLNGLIAYVFIWRQCNRPTTKHPQWSTGGKEAEASFWTQRTTVLFKGAGVQSETKSNWIGWIPVEAIDLRVRGIIDILWYDVMLLQHFWNFTSAFSVTNSELFMAQGRWSLFIVEVPADRKRCNYSLARIITP